MTYHVFGGTLNLTQLTNHRNHLTIFVSVQPQTANNGAHLCLDVSLCIRVYCMSK